MLASLCAMTVTVTVDVFYPIFYFIAIQIIKTVCLFVCFTGVKGKTVNRREEYCGFSILVWLEVYYYGLSASATKQTIVT
jgi:hypothetical protein